MTVTGRSLALVFALLLASCADPPTAPGRDITVAFCVPPLWAAYRNEGEAWRRLELPFGVARVTDRVTIATVKAVTATATLLDVHQLTSDQVEATYRCPDGGNGTGKTVHTSVSGLDATDEVYAMLGSSIAFRQNVGTLTFVGVPSGAQDLVAARQIFEPNRVRVPGVIIRRAQDIAFGASLAPLDFSSAEAVVPLEHTITFTEGAGSTSMGLQVDFVTASGAQAVIGGEESGATAPGWSLPPSVLAAGDLHFMNANAHRPGLDRSFLLFYRNGADRTLSFGPEPNAPTFTAPPAGAVARANVVSQAEYGAQIQLFVWTEGHTASMLATREFFAGTPPAWSLDLPDLQGVPGFQSSWRFPREGVTWSLGVSGQPYGFRVKNGRDGDLLRTAHLSGSAV